MSPDWVLAVIGIVTIAGSALAVTWTMATHATRMQTALEGLRGELAAMNARVVKIEGWAARPRRRRRK